jgi:hypothetical protein
MPEEGMKQVVEKVCATTPLEKWSGLTPSHLQLFFFAYVWSVGGSVANQDWAKWAVHSA